MRLKLSGAMNLFGVALTVGLVLLAAGSWKAISSQRIGGPLYDQIVAGKDLTADILPPPMYVIETYLDAQTAYLTRTPEKIADAAKEIDRLSGEYDARLVYWRKQTLSPEITQTLLHDSDVAALQVRAAARKLVAALQAQDRPPPTPPMPRCPAPMPPIAPPSTRPCRSSPPATPPSRPTPTAVRWSTSR